MCTIWVSGFGGRKTRLWEGVSYLLNWYTLAQDVDAGWHYRNCLAFKKMWYGVSGCMVVTVGRKSIEKGRSITFVQYKLYISSLPNAQCRVPMPGTSHKTPFCVWPFALCIPDDFLNQCSLYTLPSRKPFLSCIRLLQIQGFSLCWSVHHLPELQLIPFPKQCCSDPE